jgi:hypothetical protein
LDFPGRAAGVGHVLVAVGDVEEVQGVDGHAVVCGLIASPRCQPIRGKLGVGCTPGLGSAYFLATTCARTIRPSSRLRR